MADLSAIPLKTISGADASLSDHAGKVLLVVNVASKCGLTPQYEGLEKLHENLEDKGFSVLGFPANDFGAQEPGSNEEIADFCRTNFSVSFPMFQKIAVTGEEKHPLYEALITAQPAKQGDPEAFRERLRGFGMTPNPDPEVHWSRRLRQSWRSRAHCPAPASHAIVACVTARISACRVGTERIVRPIITTTA
jgi:glutathione peroxidase